MFIVSRDPKAKKSIEAFKKRLNSSIRQGEIYEIKIIDDWVLYWSPVKSSDALYSFKNGILIGKRYLTEGDSNEPCYYDDVNFELSNHSSLIQSTFLSINSMGFTVIPNEQMPVFYSQTSLSDFQLLIAKAERIYPDPLGVSMLACKGYFPGAMTLFKEVRKIPYLYKLEVPSFSLIQNNKFSPKKNDDNKIIERLIEIIPDYEKTGISMSGGTDSRLILGLLTRKKVLPKLYTLSSNESDIVKELANHLGLELVKNAEPSLSGFEFTLMSDARIYFRGGPYSRMINDYKKDELLYFGLWSAQLVSNTLNKIWKLPFKNSIERDLVEYTFFSQTKEKLMGLVAFNNREDLIRRVQSEVAYQFDYYSFSTRKEWASWFYHLNIGMSWSNATINDVSFFVHPVLPFADRIACEYGISSSAFSNMTRSRSRKMSHKLLPELKVPFSDGKSAKPLREPFLSVDKLLNEYGKDVKKYFKQRKAHINDVMKPKKEEDPNDLKELTQAKLYNYFTSGLDDLIIKKPVHKPVQRAAITINHVLAFLDESQ